MTVVDSSVWISYFSSSVETDKTRELDRLLSRDRIVVGDLILAEVLQGFRAERDYRTAKSLLLSLEYRDMTNRELALRSADNYRWLRKRGITVRRTIDVLIATFCAQDDRRADRQPRRRGGVLSVWPKTCHCCTTIRIFCPSKSIWVCGPSLRLDHRLSMPTEAEGRRQGSAPTNLGRRVDGHVGLVLMASKT